MSVGPGRVGKLSNSGWVRPCLGSPYKTIIFDVNGTLLGYEDPLGFEKRFAAACQDFCAQLSPDDVQRAMAIVAQQWSERKRTGDRRASSGEQYRRTMTWFYQALLEALGVPGDSGQQADSLYERFIIREGFMPPFSEVKETLARLRALGLRLGANLHGQQVQDHYL